jgi:polar amino acid transport system substrate-binding protein
VRRILLPIALAFALGLTACSTSAGELPPTRTEAPVPTPSASASASAPPDCKTQQPQQYLKSFDLASPPLAIPPNSTMATIKKRGQLIAGVSADTWLLGARNPLKPNGPIQIEGFDIDMLHAVAKAIFGDPNKIRYRVITAAQRIPALEEGSARGGVDIVARAMTVTCARWAQINFSTVYYVAGQKVLVAKNSAAKDIDDLSGKKVCAPKGTTTLDEMKKENPKVVPVAVNLHTDCLALFQQGKVDAITGDDTILAGFAAQDPYAKVVGERFSSEPYGLGIAKKNVDLTRFVNGVLAQERSDGTWQASYDRWLRPALGPSTPPAPLYGR